MKPPKSSVRAEQERRIRFETLLADLSAKFVALPADALDREIEEAQRLICLNLGLERSTLGQPDQDGVPQFTHAWAVPGCMPAPHSPAAPLFPWSTERIQAGHIIRFNSVDDLPAEAGTDKQSFRRVGTRSCVCFPLMVGSKAIGALSFGTVTTTRQWPDEIVRRLQLIAEVFANALARRASEATLRKALETVEALKERVEAENVSLHQDLQLLHGHPGILGCSAVLRAVLAQAEQVAAAEASVLLLGETGTGKELIASAIHDLSPRRSRRMVRVNCAAIPQTLIESELFGREKGAYTGALARQAGRFEAADGSTLFLDEIGEVPPEVQVKLLRVLEERQVERLGSSSPISVNVRIIAATNANLEERVRRGTFREDLYYRLNVFPITVPPLRERPEDIPPLVRAFVDQYATSMGKTVTSISQSSLDALQRYAWPGNVRELRNVVERAVILCRGPRLSLQVPSGGRFVAARPLAMKDVEREHILHVLEQTGWRVQGRGGAAELLGLKRTTLESRMVRLGIRRPKPTRLESTDRAGQQTSLPGSPSLPNSR